MRAGHYVGVIEEVGADGVIHAALRETPNGRELIVALARDEETWSGPTTPEPGDDIEVYTWTELHRVPDGSASPIEKMRVDVLRRQLTPEDRAAIDRAIKVLERGSDGRDGGDDAR